MNSLDERVKALRTLDANQIMVLTRLAKGASAQEIGRVLFLPPQKVHEIETAIHVKLGLYAIPNVEARRRRTQEAFEAYNVSKVAAETIAAGTPPHPDVLEERRRLSGGSNGSQAPRADAAVQELAKRISRLPSKLAAVAEHLGTGRNILSLAARMDISVNEAGLLVSNLYAALGMPRTLKKRRLLAVQAAYAELHGVPMVRTANWPPARKLTHTTQLPSADGHAKKENGMHAPAHTMGVELSASDVAGRIGTLEPAVGRLFAAVAANQFASLDYDAVGTATGWAPNMIAAKWNDMLNALGISASCPDDIRQQLLTEAWRIFQTRLANEEPIDEPEDVVVDVDTTAAAHDAHRDDELEDSGVGTGQPQEKNHPEQLPDGVTDEYLDAVAKRVGILTRHQKKVLHEVAAAGWFNNAVAAKRLGVDAPTVSQNMARIFSRLKIAEVSGRKTRFSIATLAYERHRAQMEALESSAQPDVPVPPADADVPEEHAGEVETVVVKQPSAQVAAPVSVAPLVQETTHPAPSVAPATERHRAPTSDTPAQPAMRFAPSTVVPLTDSADIRGYHVLTKLVDGNSPTDEFDDDIRRLSRAGFHPESVVTTPSEDGQHTLVQLHFVRRV